MNNITKRMQAAVMSALIAAASVPACMITTASAVFAPTVSDSALKGASTALKADVNLPKTDIPEEFDEDTPLENIIVNIESDVDAVVSFSYGVGITASKGWMEFTKDGKWTTGKGSGFATKLKKGENKIVIDVSDLKLKYGEYGNFEFRCYYCAYWDKTEGEMVDTKVTFTGFTYNEDVSAIDPGEDDPEEDDPQEEHENVVPDSNKHSNGANSESGKNWSFVDNGDGTATISSTVAKQIDGDALGKVVLTKGYDEDYYAAHPSDDPNRPMNSHKFKFSDFGLTDMEGVIVESITCTIETKKEIDQFVYGGGINVKQGSPADTEYAKQIAGIEGKEHAGYWYNDMGLEGEGSVQEFEEQGVEFGITPGNGGKLYGAGSYIEAYWEVPAEVQPHVTDKTTDSISFQYWWGNDVDGEEVESVNVTNAVITYTKTVTVPYVDSVVTAIEKTLNHTGTNKQKNLEVSYADLDIDETKDVYAIKFEISADAPIGKIIYNVGTGVTENISEDYWFQESGNYAILDAGETAEIMWIVPKYVAGFDEKHLNSINTKDGKLLLGYYYGEVKNISVDNIEVYYADAPETTTTTEATTITLATTTTVETTEKSTTTKATTTKATTTKATTTKATTTKATTTKATTTKATTTKATTTTTTTEETTTTTTEAPKKILWGDANCDGFVNIADATAIIQSIGNADRYGLSEQGALNADVYKNGSGVTGMDAMILQKLEAGHLELSDLPVDE